MFKRRFPVGPLVRRALWAGALLLAACVEPTGGVRAVSKVAVAGGAVTLSAPYGFCVDPRSTREGATGSFVLFGNCAAISGNPQAPKPPARALLSASVGPQSPQPVAENFAQIEAFFRSEAGRAALARSGKAVDVEILSARIRDKALMMKLRDRSASRGTPVAETYWRAVTGLGGRITALSVMPLAQSGLSDDEQLALLRDFVARTKSAN
ncbi:hypothetical protein LZA78_09405 [Sinirhodobacter sp. WL0062]|uniref:Uncharacterized protein n=1 Tax=Rhodobacter flavimaris TaxID=2907145 RepID=A0ABS8YX32_9RHOB|nr:hypothetical protein [Sinirhodobacter sp. WL0062]MCE5973695.1 hypothetical protein [Sinirhodobacter sp. WL0062]